MPNKQKKKRVREGMSIRRMTIWLMVAIAYVFWALAASSYLGPVFELVPRYGGRGRSGGLLMMIAGFATFFINSIRIDAIPAVFMNSLRNHHWHFWLFFLLEGAAVGFGAWLKQFEEKLNQPLRRRR